MLKWKSIGNISGLNSKITIPDKYNELLIYMTSSSSAFAIGTMIYAYGSEDSMIVEYQGTNYIVLTISSVSHFIKISQASQSDPMISVKYR